MLKKYRTLLWLIAKVLFLLFFIFIAYYFYSRINKVSKTNTPVVNASPTGLPPSSLQPVQVTYPSQVLNLSNWKLTLPTGSSGNPTEIKQPKLATFNVNPWFTVVPEGNAVSFRAAVNGVTTSGSDYPRSELREMVDNGKINASWSTKEGTHTMFLDQAITAVPKIKQQVVAGQIHDENRDIIVIRLDYPILHIRISGTNVHTLDSNYTLGKRFTVKFMVNGGMTKVYYNNSADPVYTLSKKYSNAYFKAGVYTQSNCSREGAASLCNDNNYGEAVVYQAMITHQ